MVGSYTFFSKFFSPSILSGALQTFDRATIVIVSACWGGAIMVMLFALYTLSLSVEAKKASIEAAAQEPTLPVLVTSSPSERELKPLVSRLQKRFPGIEFDLTSDRSVSVRTRDSGLFRVWLTVLSYIDTISPQYRWKIKTFCVGGECSSSVPMQAILKAEKISFSVKGRS